MQPPNAARRNRSAGPGPGPHSSPLLPELISFSSLRHDDLLICGAEPQGVEEHQVTTRGAFNPHGEGQVTVAVLAQGVAVSAGRNAALYQEHGPRADANRIRQAAHGTS